MKSLVVKLTQAQIKAGQDLVRYLIKKIGITHIFAHRQSYSQRQNDPGPDIWHHIGQWAIDQRELSDGGPNYKISSGKPIPDIWRYPRGA
ncbi:MAG: N-acetylmuramoyl-L-alanine amidase [Cyanothece sp. SIO1E1]|nr:N-acetylmuramoyl-L-alanine amidase [Cyanothece sp. SIO1E1]